MFQAVTSRVHCSGCSKTSPCRSVCSVKAQVGVITKPGRMKKAPLGIRKASYARGEVDREEYVQRRDDLAGKYWIAFCFRDLSSSCKQDCNKQFRAFRLTCCPLSRRRLDQKDCASLTRPRGAR